MLITTLLVCFFEILRAPAHPVHVSVCNIELSENECSLSIKLFRDDFELALSNYYHSDPQTNGIRGVTDTERISNYINSSFRISQGNGKQMGIRFQKSEVIEEAIWLYYELENPGNIISLKIQNSLMLDLYDDQTNLVIIAINGKEKGYMFNRKKTEADIDLK